MARISARSSGVLSEGVEQFQSEERNEEKGGEKAYPCTRRCNCEAGFQGSTGRSSRYPFDQNSLDRIENQEHPHVRKSVNQSDRPTRVPNLQETPNDLSAFLAPGMLRERKGQSQGNEQHTVCFT